MANKSMMFGRSTEYLVISKFLGEGREVYVPPVDDHGVDLIVVPQDSCTNLEKSVAYQEIQVKSKAKDGQFSAIACPNPRENYWFIFYVKSIDTFWIINSIKFVEIASKNVKGKHIDKYSFSLASKTKQGLKPNPKYSEYIVKDFSVIPIP